MVVQDVSIRYSNHCIPMHDRRQTNDQITDCTGERQGAALEY